MPCSSTSRSQARCLCWALQRKRDSLCPHTSSSCWGPAAIALPGTQRERTRLGGSQGLPQGGKEGRRHRGAPRYGGRGMKTSQGKGVGDPSQAPRDPPEHSLAAPPEPALRPLLPPPRPLTTPSQHSPTRPTPRLSPASANHSAHLTISGLLLDLSLVCHPAIKETVLWPRLLRPRLLSRVLQEHRDGQAERRECDPFPWQPMGRVGRLGRRAVIGCRGGAGLCLNGVPRARGR